MSLRRKTILIIIVTSILLCLVMCLSLKYILVNKLTEMENRDTYKNVDRAVYALNNEIQSLDSTAADRAYWDEAYSFMSDKNQSFIDNNMTDSTFGYLKLNFMILVDNTGRVVFAKGFDLNSNSAAPVPASLLDEIKTRPKLLRSSTSPRPSSGLLSLPEAQMLVASYPILPGDQEGEIRGTLLVGRSLDAPFLKRLGNITQLDLALQDINNINYLPDYRNALSIVTSFQPVAVRVVDHNTIAGYTILEDIFGRPALALRVELSRAVFLEAQSVIYYAAVFLVLMMVLFGILIMFILEKLVLFRLFNLSREVKTISGGGIGCRVSERGQDELGELAQSINGMLFELEHSHLQRLDSDNRLLSITENMLDMIAQIDCSLRFQYCSPSYKKMLGFTTEELIGRQYLALVHPKEYELVERCLLQVMDSCQPGYCEFRCRSASGSYMWLETVINIITDNDGQVSGAVLVGRDVTSRKQVEERIRFISLHDPLTGLYNRTYFEHEMLSLENSELFPLGMMICDLDGLKFINDTLGHSTGDSLIIKAAKIIENCAGEGSIISRIGGDEFAVLIQPCNRHKMESIYTAIKEQAAEQSKKAPDMPLAISIGFAFRLNSVMNMADLFREADNNMYREKLYSHQSGHSGLISSLMQALLERDLVTRNHVKRIDHFVLIMGTALGLSHSSLLDLRLFAQFHDIGKVGVPDSVLLKSDFLTEEERLEMQRHSEIGYRIARAAIDLQPVADLILKHHEWWNGHGYPLGLHGKEIPLECRILAVCDAYEAMTSERPYRSALPREQALEELQRCAGSQFDPDLVRVFIDLIEDRQSS